MSAIPRYRPYSGPAILAAGFRPFFLLAAAWSALAVPLWVFVFGGRVDLPTALDPVIWHAHEMIYGYAGAVVAGFLLTAIPNWTGRMPLQGAPLAMLVLLWLAGRVAVLSSAATGPLAAAILDLAFPLVFLAVVAREIVAGRNARNAPMLAALTLLLAGNALVHLEALGVADTAMLGVRTGIATLLMLIGLVGGRIIPSFTGNWLRKERAESAPPAPFSRYDRVTLAVTAVALLAWAAQPEFRATPWLALAAGLLQAGRLARWKGGQTAREPMLWVLHLGYGWLALGLVLLASSAFIPWLPPSAAMHALTAGAIGTMPLAVMSRATLGHTGRPLVAGRGTIAVYALVTLAAAVRVLAPLAGDRYMDAVTIAGAGWCAAFALFVAVYFRALVTARRDERAAIPT